MSHDVVIIGGGPAGLSAALALGRARKRVLLCDAGPRRNAAAEHIHNFVTRDGTPPDAFRSAAREQLAQYANVTVRDMPVQSIAGTRGAFDVATPEGTVRTRRVMICTGMIDEMLPIEGFADAWGRSIVQCPYCHGWEHQDQRWAYLARGPHAVQFAIQLRGWTREVRFLTNSTLDLPDATRAQFTAAGVSIDTRAVTRIGHRDGQIETIGFDDGTSVPCDLLFTHPTQRQVSLVTALGLALDDDGFVRTDPMTRETSVPGIYAAGDLTTRMQAAIAAAASGVHAAAALNHELTTELATQGLL